MGESPVHEKTVAPTRVVLDRIAAGPLRERLRAEMARKHHRRSADDIRDAFQEACTRALTHCRWHHEHQVYGWLRRTMDNLLSDEDRRERHELPADTADGPFLQLADGLDEPPVERAGRIAPS